MVAMRRRISAPSTVEARYVAETPADGEERLHRMELPGAKSGVAQPRQARVEIEPRRGGGLGDAARAHAISRSASATPRGCDRDSWPTTRSRSGTQPS